MFLSRNKKNNVYPCKPQFYYIKVGFKGIRIIYVYLRDESVKCVSSPCMFGHLYGFLDSHLTNILGRKLSFRLYACSVLIMVQLL